MFRFLSARRTALVLSTRYLVWPGLGRTILILRSDGNEFGGKGELNNRPSNQDFRNYNIISLTKYSAVVGRQLIICRKSSSPNSPILRIGLSSSSRKLALLPRPRPRPHHPPPRSPVMIRRTSMERSDAECPSLFQQRERRAELWPPGVNSKIR